MNQAITRLPVPSHFSEIGVGEIRTVDYMGLQHSAEDWARQYGVRASGTDKFKIALVLIDVQNTFCIPGASLFVAGQNGNGAVEDNIRLCRFIYENLGVITRICPTMDTHFLMQIFHPYFWVDSRGRHPDPMTQISVDDVENRVWMVNPAVVSVMAKGSLVELEEYALHYVRTLAAKGKYPLTIWPYHGMLGGVGHALVAAVEEACFFQAVARASQTDFLIKGGNPLTENYSPSSVEVDTYPDGRKLAQRNPKFLELLLAYDAVIGAGQAKSHCFKWWIDDLLTDINFQDPDLARKVYLLEDCTSPVVVEGVVDFSPEADEAFERFAAAGMNLVQTTIPIEDWPGIRL